MHALLFLLVPLAWAGPGFDGVGDQGRAPRFEKPPHEQRMVDEVLAREAEILASVEQSDPAMYQRLQRLKEADSQAYVVTLVRVARRVDRMNSNPESRARFQQIQELEARLKALAEAHGQAGSPEQARLRREMSTIALQLFDAKQAERRAQLSELEAKMQKLRDEIQERDAQRDALIEAYVDQLVGTRVDL